jgi:hypothetical protein
MAGEPEPVTYLRNGQEFLDDDETAVYAAIKQLAAERRTGNTSQVASYSGLNRTRVTKITAGLRARGFIADVSANAAHHWQVTAQPVPYSTEQRRQDRENRENRQAARLQREADAQDRQA